MKTDHNEEWRDIPSLGGFYEASSLGRIRRTKTGRVLIQNVRRDGYRRVDPSIAGKRTSPMVHALVCEAFHGPRPEGLQCGHLDGVKSNNAASNFAWITHLENAAHRQLHGGQVRGSRCNGSKLTEEKVAEIRAMAARGVKGSELARRFGVTSTTIYKILDRTTWKWSTL